MIAEEEAIESSPKSLPLHLEDSVSHPLEETNSSPREEVKPNRREKEIKCDPQEVTKSNPKDEMKSSPQEETKSSSQKEIKSSPQEEIKKSNGTDDHHNHQLLSQNDSYFLAKVILLKTLENSDYTNPGEEELCFLVSTGCAPV